MTSVGLLQRLLNKGDEVEIREGELNITPASGKKVPIEWLQENKWVLIAEIAKATGITAYKVEDHSVGRYGPNCYSGLTLQLSNVVSLDECYTIFNVITSRARSSKKGSKGTSLPKGQFRVNKSHQFYKLWQKTGLKMPRSTSQFSDRLGKLRKHVYTGTLSKENRVDTKSFAPVNVTVYEIKSALENQRKCINATDNYRTFSGQATDNTRTTSADKDSSFCQTDRGLQRDLTTGVFSHDKSNQGGTCKDSSLNGSTSVLPPQEQSTEEWLDAYD